MDKKVFINGKIYSLNKEGETFEALASSGGYIVDIGTSEKLKGYKHFGYEMIDLKGSTVIPGLIDAHTHFVSFAKTLDFVNLDGVNSLDDALSKIAKRVEEKGEGEWIIGRGWDQYLWGMTAFPTKEILDRVTPNNPAVLIRKDGHMVWTNSKTLKLLGITRKTPDPKGGKIERKEGEPVGIFTEKAVDMILSRLPHPDKESLFPLFERAQEIALSNGLTGVHTFESHREFDLLTEFYNQKKLDIRVFYGFEQEELPKMVELGFKSYFGDHLLTLGVLKLFKDGSLGSRTAYMFEPFEGEPQNYGQDVLPNEELKEIVTFANRHGIAVSVHAIGDHAVHDVLMAFSDTYEIAKEKGLRNRVEHFQIVKPEDMELAKKIGIIASMQPIHAVKDRYVADKFWGKRCKGSAYAWKTILKKGIPLAFGTDVPVETLNPFYSIYTAIVRHDVGEESPWYPEERLTLYEALSAYTKGSAYAEKKEFVKGTLEPGKVADFLVLPENPFEVDPEEFYKLKPLATVVGGEVKTGDIK